MQTKEFVKLVKKNFQVMPTTREVKKFIIDNRYTVNTESAYTAVTKAYLREENPKRIKLDKESIVKLINEGYKHEEIARRLFVSKSTLSDYKREYGLTGYRVSKGDRIQKIMDLIKQDIPTKEIASMMGVSVNTVCRYRRCSGLPPKVIYKVDVEEMKELLKTNSQRETADILGVSEACISKRVQRCRENGDIITVIKSKRSRGQKKIEIPKERILDLVKQGYNTNAKMIEQLGISGKTYIRIKKELEIQRLTDYEG